MNRSEKIRGVLFDILGYCVLLFCVLFVLVACTWLVIGVVFQPVIIYTQAQCAEHGWTGGDVSWRFDKYCIRSVLGDEVIAPLDWVKSNCNKLGECQE